MSIGSKALARQTFWFHFYNTKGFDLLDVKKVNRDQLQDHFDVKTVIKDDLL